MNCRFAPAAQAEFLGAIEWYLTDGGPVPAASFESAVQRAVRLLTLMPRLGTPSHRGTRCWPVRDYPYSLIYRIDSHGIAVIAIAHQRREPGYWHGR